MTSVLFVCLGNICRSPAAEGVFTRLAREAGWLDGAPRLRIDSAGTGAWHIGHPPDPRMIETARGRGVDIGHLRARQVTARDIEAFEHVIAMDRDNLRALQRLAPHGLEAKPRLLLSLVENAPGPDVPDPYYGGPEGFERCLDLIKQGSQALFDEIAQKI